jgi:pSer/pThr/pTyr-binding forkhead associated (FHA) protein
MAKLVVVTEGLSGRSHELTAERTTVGRVEDNTFPIAEPSISSHHCEILLQGSEVRIKDLNSTNGTFIDGQQIN